jgi:hypothetical protein
MIFKYSKKCAEYQCAYQGTKQEDIPNSGVIGPQCMLYLFADKHKKGKR